MNNKIEASYIDVTFIQEACCSDYAYNSSIDRMEVDQMKVLRIKFQIVIDGGNSKKYTQGFIDHFINDKTKFYF
jgi:hypothetical protein